MSEKLSIDIIAPTGIASHFAATMVVIPGEEGELGIMRGHVPMIVGSKYGFVKFFEGNKITGKIFISDSFIEINESRVVILTDRMINLEKEPQLDISKIINDLEAKLSKEKSASIEHKIAFFRHLQEQITEVS